MPPADPDWILKRHAGRKLDEDELEEFLQWNHKMMFKKFYANVKGVEEDVLKKIWNEN